jgi:chorismate mutase
MCLTVLAARLAFSHAYGARLSVLVLHHGGKAPDAAERLISARPVASIQRRREPKGCAAAVVLGRVTGRRMNARQEIEEARREIDQIDDAIVDLLVQRSRSAVRIGRAKRREGVPVRDPAREAAVLARLVERARGKLDALAIERVFDRIMELTRSLEEKEQAGT